MKKWENCSSYSMASAPYPKSAGDRRFQTDSGFKAQGA